MCHTFKIQSTELLSKIYFFNIYNACYMNIENCCFYNKNYNTNNRKGHV